MEMVISIGYGEIALKKGNRNFFVKLLRDRIKDALMTYKDEIVLYEDRSKFYIETKEENLNPIVERLKRVFGIVTIHIAYRVDKDLDAIEDMAVKIMKLKLENSKTKTFKVTGKRADKKFPMNSMEIAKHIGGVVLKADLGYSVDVHNPETYLNIEIRNYAYLWFTKEHGAGGLPVGSNGKALLLLSGGIDSPVAGYMVAKRGVKISGIHFHSYPFTSDRAEEKVLNLAKIVARYNGMIKIFSINLLDIQKEIHEKCPEDEMTLLSRRMMMRLAEKIALREKYNALITGESLGQVASQTIQGLDVTNATVDMPVFRPLIGMDKTEIMDIAKKIDTFETSILPFEDCCTVFLPKHPVTKPKRKRIEDSEEVLDIPKMLDEAIKNMKVYKVNSEEIKCIKGE